MNRRQKSFGVTLILGGVLCSAAFSQSKDPLVVILKLLLKPLVDPVNRKNAADAASAAEKKQAEVFAEKTKYGIVIANTSNKVWKLGFIKDYKSELNDKQSGTVLVSQLNNDGSMTKLPGSRGDGTLPSALNPGYCGVAITPVNEKSGYITWEKFFRVCYLEDVLGNRIYLNITKDVALYAIPTLGIAQESNGVVMRQKAIQFSDPAMKNFHMIGITVDNLAGAPKA